MESRCDFSLQHRGAESSRVQANPILRGTRAALDGRIYVLPTGSHYWGTIGAEDPLAQLWMAELLYPELLERTALCEMRAVYERLFNRTFTDAELDKVLLTELNGRSRHYDRFSARSG